MSLFRVDAGGFIGIMGHIGVENHYSEDSLRYYEQIVVEFSSMELTYKFDLGSVRTISDLSARPLLVLWDCQGQRCLCPFGIG